MALKFSINNLWTSCTSMLRNFAGNSKEKTRSSWSVIWVKYQERILFAENSEVKKKKKLEKTAAIKDTTKKKTNLCESWSDDSEPLTGTRNCVA